MIKSNRLVRFVFKDSFSKELDFKDKVFDIQRSWKIALVLIAMLVSTTSGSALGIGSLFSITLLIGSSGTIYGIIVLTALVFTTFIIARRGFALGLACGVALLLPSLLLSVFTPGNESNIDIGISFFIGTSSVTLISLGVLLAVVAMRLLVVVINSSAVATIFYFAASVAMSLTTIQSFRSNFILTSMPLIIGCSVFAAYINFLIIEKNSAFNWVKQLVIFVVTQQGNLFRRADLTDVDFTGSDIKFCDFREANLQHTRFLGTQGLELSRLENTYLANPKIRQLVVTCKGQGQNFDGLDLTGVNLQGADLQDASFIGANLNQSSLRGANLSRAILKQTQLDDADLTDATLTGACIEDWGITSKTKLEGVKCEYVYMRLPTPEKRNPLRKPDDERKNFSEGEFADFIQPYFETLDLYHRQDVDPRSISVALKTLIDNHPDAQLEFVAIEWRGRGLNIRYTTAPDVDKSELNHEYFKNYARIRKELLGSLQLRLTAQNAEISRMEDVINKFIQTGTHPSTIQADSIQVIQGEFVVTENRGININAGGNANISGISSGDGIVNLGTISGNVSNAINQLPESSEPDQPNLKTLLAQLQQAIETDADLPETDKSDLLEQVQSLAEAKQTEEPAKREGLMRKAMKMFDATLKGLPDTAKIVEACSKLLPLILKALGFPA